MWAALARNTRTPYSRRATEPHDADAHAPFHQRLTNAFSKKVENHTAAIALHFMCYNFCRKHQTLGTTPAVASGVADHEWTLREVAELLEVDAIA